MGERKPPILFRVLQPIQRRLHWSDLVVVLGIAALLYAGVSLAVKTPMVLKGPEISLSPRALPYYASLSLGRMTIAYFLSLCFALIYGRAASQNHRVERVLLPLLDVLQSIPILSFLPVVLLSVSAILPQAIAVELASIILIFTGQVWNLTFGWYQSLQTIPQELREASTIFRFNGWLRFRMVELPFATIGLVWNSMMSWSGGWFFLMAAEIFTVGDRDFRLPGLGAFLKEAANRGNLVAILWGITTLVLIIVILDQLLWRPLLAWSSRFKLDMVSSDESPTSWFYDVLRSSDLMKWVGTGLRRAVGYIDRFSLQYFPPASPLARRENTFPWGTFIAGITGVGLFYGTYHAWGMLRTISQQEWMEIGIGVLATLLRVIASLVLALAWTVPLGVAIGTKPRLAAKLQPIVQVAASVPATALFPVFLLFMLPLPGGMNLAAVLLMLMGTQWYVLFNVIAGAAAIPKDLQDTAALLQLHRQERWRVLILPALFPYIITGAVTASGGAWNASIVAEYFDFGGRIWSIRGLGSIIARATAGGNYPLLLAATLAMIVTVATINRFVWRRLYRLAEEQYRLD